MNPLMLIAGLLVGILPRPWHLFGLLVTAASWPLFIVILDPTYADNAGWLVRSFGLSAANVAFGVIFMKRIVRPMAMLAQSLDHLRRDRSHGNRPQ